MSGSTREINNTTGFWAAFRVPLSPLPLLCFAFLLLTVVHSESCSFFLTVHSSECWTGFGCVCPCLLFFSSCWEDVIFGWCWLTCRLILVSGWFAEHSAYVFLTCCGVSALDCLIVFCDWQPLFASEQFLLHSGDFACSIALTSSSNTFLFTFSAAYSLSIASTAYSSIASAYSSIASAYSLSIASIFTFSASSFFVSAFSCVSSPYRLL